MASAVSNDELVETENIITNRLKLPDEILVQIFAQLRLEDQVKCRMVCRHWNELIPQAAVTVREIFTPDLIKFCSGNFDRHYVSRESRKSCEKFSVYEMQERLNYVLSLCPRVEGLQIGCRGLSTGFELERMLITISQKCPRLRKVHFDNYYAVNYEYQQLKNISLPSVTELTFNPSDNNRVSIESVLENIPNEVTSRQVHDLNFIRAVAMSCPNLRVLDIANNSHVSEKVFKDLPLPYLEKVDLSYCYGMTSNVLKHLLCGSRNSLTHVSAKYSGSPGIITAPWCYPHYFRDYLRKFHNLEYLHFSTDFKLNRRQEFCPKERNALATIGRLQKLRHLSLGSIFFCVHDGDLAAIVSGCTRLTYLDISGNFDPTPKCLSVAALCTISGLQNLTHLDIGHNRNVNEQVMQSISQLSKLEFLSINACKSVGIYGMRPVLSLGSLRCLRNCHYTWDGGTVNLLTDFAGIVRDTTLRLELGMSHTHPTPQVAIQPINNEYIKIF